jgi:hypothetical protein
MQVETSLLKWIKTKNQMTGESVGRGSKQSQAKQARESPPKKRQKDTGAMPSSSSEQASEQHNGYQFTFQCLHIQVLTL